MSEVPLYPSPIGPSGLPTVGSYVNVTYKRGTSVMQVREEATRELVVTIEKFLQ